MGMTTRVSRVGRSRRCWAVLVLGVVGVMVGTSGARADNWDYFKSPAGRFSVRVPETPKATVSEKHSFIGTITNHIFTVLREDHYEKFTVDYSDIPSFAVEFTGADTIIDHAKGALLSTTHAKPISYIDLKVDGHKGKKLVYDVPPRDGHPELRGEAIFVVVGDRLYVVDAQLPADQHKDGGAKRFFESLDFQ